MLSDTITECRQVDTDKDRFALAKHDRGQGKMHLVNQPGAKILTDRFYATANFNVAPTG